MKVDFEKVVQSGVEQAMRECELKNRGVFGR